jgi:hypothetical protein
MRRNIFIELVLMEYINQLKIILKKNSIVKIKMKNSIIPNSTQGWVELHQYDLGFYWLNLLIYKTQIIENWKEGFCMGIYK